MARGDDVRLALRPVDRDADSARPVGCGNAGGDAFAGLNRDSEGGLVAGAVVAAHQFQAELFDAFAGKRQADQSAAVGSHEVDRVRSCHLRGDNEIALVLAVFVIDQDEHAPVARLVDDFLDRHEHRPVVVGEQEVVELAEGFSGGVPTVFSAIAQRVGVKSGSAGEAGLAHAALGDDQADSLDGGL